VKNTPNYHKMYQTAIRNTKWLSNIPNGHRIYQHFTFRGPPKFTQTGIFGLKRNHLATLLVCPCTFYCSVSSQKIFGHGGEEQRPDSRNRLCARLLNIST
jgi:hypothetical protein